jgi:DNA-binding MarR family transcriptional regulator
MIFLSRRSKTISGESPLRVTDKEEIDQVLFKFLQSIYLFERREASLFDVTWDEVYLLQLLIRQPGLPVSALSRLMKVVDFVVSRMITRLAKTGLVRRESSKVDKRVVQVYITEAGKEKVEAIEQFNYQTVSAQFPRLGDQEIEVLLQSIGNLSEFLGLDAPIQKESSWN